MFRRLSSQELAKLARDLCGMPYNGARRMAESGLIDAVQPVPDALLPAQQAFEARILYTLVEAFPDRDQTADAFVGVEAVRPDPLWLELSFDSNIAPHAIAALVPHYDPTNATVVGVPGLRLRQDSRQTWVASCATDLSGTCVLLRVRQSAMDDAIALLNGLHDQGMRPQKGQLTWRERDGIRWQRSSSRRARVASTNLLISRVLRRIRIIHDVGHAHGFVNVYHHRREDLVLEWCCGPDVPTFARYLYRSGIVQPQDARIPPSPPALDDASRPGHTLSLGDACLILRRNSHLHRAYIVHGRPLSASRRLGGRGGRRR